MTDQQRLRDVLIGAVPTPPEEPSRGASARRRARTSRRLGIALSGGVILAVTAASAGIWALHQKDEPPAVSGTGKAACRQLVREVKAGRYVDSRVVDGSTAASWLGDIPTHVDPTAYRGDRRVTVCLTSKGTTYATYAIGDTGHHQRITLGGYDGTGGAEETMAALDRLWTGGAKTTDAPFSCAAPRSEHYPDVTSSLPDGATGARICFGGLFYTPSQVLTRGVDQLVAAVNATEVGYSPPHFVCSPGDINAYTIVLRYPSGTREVSADPCRGLMLGRVARGGDVDDTFMSLLSRQVGVSPGSVSPPPCSATWDRPEGVGDVRNVVAARYCPDRTGGPAAVLSGEQLRLLRAWGHSLDGADSVPEHACSRPPAGWPRLSLADAWGNSFSLLVEGCGRRVFPTLVSTASSAQLAHPDGSRGPFLRLAHQLAVPSP